MHAKIKIFSLLSFIGLLFSYASAIDWEKHEEKLNSELTPTKVIQCTVFLGIFSYCIANKNLDSLKTLGLLYLSDRVITVAHELGHGLTASSIGVSWDHFHISPWFYGGGSINIKQEMTFIKSLLVMGAGPITGMLIGVFLGHFWFKQNRNFLATLCLMSGIENFANLIPVVLRDGWRYKPTDGWYIKHSYKNSGLKFITLD